MPSTSPTGSCTWPGANTRANPDKPSFPGSMGPTAAARTKRHRHNANLATYPAYFTPGLLAQQFVRFRWVTEVTGPVRDPRLALTFW
jgi:hypothetical protein